MRQKFFTDTIQSKFIKNILHNTPLPLYDTINDESYIFKDRLYINKSRIVKCIKSGYVNNGAKVEEVINYTFGEYDKQYTTTFTSNYNYYDSKTHEVLGKYLRCIRDIHEIDLMPFYNCFSNRYLTKYGINKDGIYTTNKNKLSYKIAMVPIKFNTKYTIALDSDSKVEVCCGLFNEEQLLDIQAKPNEVKLQDELFNSSHRVYSSCSFRRPFLYEIKNEKSALQEFESMLYLLVKADRQVRTSLVVLEGDYTHNSCKQIINEEYIESLSNADLNKILISDLSLLRINTKISYPFADRLIEYLLLNVIHLRDEYKQNILYIQRKLGRDVDINMKEGVWENKLRKKLFDLHFNELKTAKLDINGFVDKDIEKMLTEYYQYY